MWIKNIKLFFLLSLLTGFVYPLCVYFIAQFFWPHQANGSFVFLNGEKRGSLLIAQSFKDPSFFWPRPSHGNYNPLDSGGSNLSPTSKKLQDLVKQRASKLADIHAVPLENVPSELVFSSASGLDPHISLNTAYFQIERIVKAKQLDPIEGKKILSNLIEKHKITPFFSPPYVNVLELNLELEKVK